MRSSDPKLVDIAGELRGETDKAYRIFDGARTEWVPKSQSQMNDDGTFTMPEWLAKERGFI
jgi:RNase P/RNase MRP subunit p29